MFFLGRLGIFLKLVVTTRGRRCGGVWGKWWPVAGGRCLGRDEDGSVEAGQWLEMRGGTNLMATKLLWGMHVSIFDRAV